MTPPDCKPAWDDCNVEAQAEIIAYHQVREHEEHELRVALAKAGAAAAAPL